MYIFRWSLYAIDAHTVMIQKAANMPDGVGGAVSSRTAPKRTYLSMIEAGIPYNLLILVTFWS